MLFDMVPPCGPVSISQKSWDVLRDAVDNELVPFLCKNYIFTEMNGCFRQVAEP